MTTIFHDLVSFDISQKGYSWRNSKPDKVSDKLNYIKPDQDQTYKGIEGNWYIYGERSD